MNNEQLLQKLRDPAAEYRPVPFWFINHFLQPDELRRQIREMAQKGLGGFMFHGRDGLRSRYLEDEWEQGLKVALAEADKLGLHVWLYDESHYPSGIAGTKVFEKFPGRFMKSLTMNKEVMVAPGGKLNLSISDDIRYVLAFPATGKCKSESQPQDLLPLSRNGELNWKNNSRLHLQVLVMREDNYHPGPGNTFEYYPDYLDPEVMREFINLTHEWYHKKFGHLYGRLIKGIFTDNACAHFGHLRQAIPWSRNWEQRFKERTGQDIKSVLPGLFHQVHGYQENRLLFWRFLGDEFLDTFVNAILKHCKNSGIFSTGHYCLEEGLSEHVRQIGDYFQVMKHQSLNAVDQLGPSSKNDGLLGDLHGEHVTSCIKNTASAAALYGSPRVMCESFGLASGWNFDLQEMRRISGYLAALGVDLFAPHGIYYSIAGNRKYECIPDHFHNPMWEYYRKWSDWIGRLSWLSEGADSVAEVAVLHPTTTLQAYIELGQPHANYGVNYKQAELDTLAAAEHMHTSDRGEICDRVDATFVEVVESLVKGHIGFEILPEEALQRSKVNKNTLEVPTRRNRPWKFKTLILPYTLVLEKKTVKLVASFLRSGGHVICVGEPPRSSYDPLRLHLQALDADSLPGILIKRALFASIAESPQQADGDNYTNWLLENSSQPLLVNGGENKVVSRVWDKAGCRFYMIHNCTASTVANISLTFMDKRDPVLFDLDHPEFMKSEGKRQGDRFSCKINLPSSATRLWVTGNSITPPNKQMIAQARTAATKSLKIKGDWNFSTATTNILPLRNGQIKYEEFWQCCDFKFRIKSRPSELRLLIDAEMTRAELISDTYASDLRISINGKPVPPPFPGERLDRWIFETDLSNSLKLGENILQIVRGSIFLTPGRVWNSYLSGDFSVSEQAGCLILDDPPRKLQPGDCATHGYPFYSGEFIYRQILRLPKACQNHTVWLDLGEIANAVEVLVDGVSLGKCILPPWRYELPTTLRNDSINLEIRVINTPQNLFGKERVKAGLLGPVTLYW